jgi:hypothetical protein
MREVHVPKGCSSAGLVGFVLPDLCHSKMGPQLSLLRLMYGSPTFCKSYSVWMSGDVEKGQDEAVVCRIQKSNRELGESPGAFHKASYLNMGSSIHTD